MTVKELISELKKMPKNARVYHLWDGELRTAINLVYETREGKVATADFSEDSHSTNSRPKNAPSYEENPHWRTADPPEGFDLDD